MSYRGGDDGQDSKSSQSSTEQQMMHIAVVGCSHGELEAMYDLIAETERRQGIKVDLLLCCGDFQSVRNESDLACMACPVKYRDMVTFWKYHSGGKKAPVPTIFIHGNHEASNYLLELFHGGYVAPNIYFLGFAGKFLVDPH